MKKSIEQWAQELEQAKEEVIEMVNLHLAECPQDVKDAVKTWNEVSKGFLAAVARGDK